VSSVPFPIFSRGGFLCGNDAALFFTCFGYVVLLLVGSANLGHRRLHSSRPMDFNKRRETPSITYWRISNKRREASSIAYWQISRSLIVLPHFFLDNRTSPEKPV
jgi:hypothetical protein